MVQEIYTEELLAFTAPSPEQRTCVYACLFFPNWIIMKTIIENKIKSIKNGDNLEDKNRKGRLTSCKEENVYAYIYI